jgi:hypothetical protein
MDKLESQRSWPKPITQRNQSRSELPNQDENHEVQEHVSLQYDLIRERSIVSFAQSKYKIGKVMVCETRTRKSEEQASSRLCLVVIVESCFENFSVRLFAGDYHEILVTSSSFTNDEE